MRVIDAALCAREHRIVEDRVAAQREAAAGQPSEPDGTILGALRARGWRGACKELLKTLGLGALVRLLSASGRTEAAAKSTEAVTREVLADMKAAPAHDGGAPPVPESGSRAAPPVDVHMFLEKMRERERNERESVDARLALARARERSLYAAHLVCALLTVVLAFGTVGLVLAGLVPVAVASGAIGILPGAGTLLLRRMWREERSHRDALEERRNEHAELLDAIEFALALPDAGERGRQAAALSQRLQERAFAGSSD